MCIITDMNGFDYDYKWPQSAFHKEAKEFTLIKANSLLC